MSDNSAAVVRCERLADGSLEFTIYQNGRPITQPKVIQDRATLQECFSSYCLPVSSDVRSFLKVGDIQVFPVSDLEGYIACAGLERVG